MSESAGVPMTMSDVCLCYIYISFSKHVRIMRCGCVSFSFQTQHVRPATGAPALLLFAMAGVFIRKMRLPHSRTYKIENKTDRLEPY